MYKSVYIRTFGCQMNFHDSEKMLGILEKEGFTETDNPSNADIIIFNTCSIRQKAEQKFYSELGRSISYKKRKTGMKIVIGGCIAQQEGKNIFKRFPDVDSVLGPQNIYMLKDLIMGKRSSIAIDDNPEIVNINLPLKRADRLRAWVTIMYGCNNFCSFCIVPYTRGRERSRPSEHIISEVNKLAEDGYKEITLLGQNVNSYNSDLDFPGLLRHLNKIEGIKRIRFVTSHPRDLKDDLINAISELQKVCEHIHLPLQSGSNRILKLMNRGYTYEEYADKILRIREKVKGISITSDIIVGFPGETDEDYLKTMTALKEIEFDGIFSFKYSARPKTIASKMECQINDDTKSDRLKHLIEIQDKITEMKNKALEGTVQEVLLEGESETDKNKFTGRTRSNKIVNFQKINIQKGSILLVEITKGRKHSLEGKPINI
ncbi:MAG: tRNA (N6-isopentenyl adenosine(37)-C2)-methylthiotransferase MiaB [Nitrospirae bacterium]|nr:tRNA (N6-isopentenyl adenosine(37)-C2)-methylthiotransferase MiaB [Nitrospirota bacterium]